MDMKTVARLLILLPLLWGEIAWAVRTDSVRSVLVELYQFTDGDNWADNSGWLSADNHCDWFGVSCFEGNVTWLTLGGNRLSGVIPESLGSLTTLEYLYLNNNALTGQIPESIGNLTNLQTLALDDNQLSGGIGESLGEFVAARSNYDLSGNSFYCPYPLALSEYFEGLGEDCLDVASVPARPVITETEINSEEITLSFVVGDNGGASITGYNATCTDGTNTFTGTSTSSPITVSGLTNDVAYTCKVTATNSVGTSSVSAATASITPEETATGLPIWLLYQATQ